MTGTIVPVLVAVALALAGCSLKPVRTRDFQGDVHLRSLVVDFDDIVDGASGGVVAGIKRTQKLLQEIDTARDPGKREAIGRQMVEFQETLIERLRERSGLPLVVVPDPVPSMTYGPSTELAQIVFAYPEAAGAALDLRANLSYPSVESTNLGLLGDALGRRRLKVKPKLAVRAKGFNAAGGLFWREAFGHTSDSSYTLADDYVLGVSRDEIRDGDIFLIRLAGRL